MQSGGLLQATPHCVMAGHTPHVSRESFAVFMEPGEAARQGPKASFLELVIRISTLLGKDPPKKPTPDFLLQVAAKIGNFLSIFTRKQPQITPEIAYFVCHDENMSSTKAIAELDYRETPLDISLKETYDWLLQAGQLEKPTLPRHFINF